MTGRKENGKRSIRIREAAIFVGKAFSVFICMQFFVIGITGTFIIGYNIDLTEEVHPDHNTGAKISNYPAMRGEFFTDVMRAVPLQNIYYCISSAVFSTMAIFGVLKNHTVYIMPFITFQMILGASAMIAIFFPSTYDRFQEAACAIVIGLLFAVFQMMIMKVGIKMFVDVVGNKGRQTGSNKEGDLESNFLKASPLNIIVNMSVAEAEMIPMAIKCARLIAKLYSQQVTVITKSEDTSEEIAVPIPFKPDVVVAIPPPYDNLENLSATPDDIDSQSPPPYELEAEMNEIHAV